MEPVAQPVEDVITGLEFLVDLPGCDPSWFSRMEQKMWRLKWGANWLRGWQPWEYFNPNNNGSWTDKIWPFLLLNVPVSFFLSFQFLGDWYVLEYEYPKEMRLKDISCVGLHFSLTSFGDILTNFTFRFPAKSGHFYHVPTFSMVSQLKTSIWETQFRGGAYIIPVQFFSAIQSYCSRLSVVLLSYDRRLILLRLNCRKKSRRVSV